MPGTTLLEALASDVWTTIKAMPVQTDPRFFLDAVFLGNERAFAISGNDWLDSNGREAFLLEAYIFKREGWWAPESDWSPVEIVDPAAFHTFLLGPRTVEAFASKRLPSLESDSIWSKIDTIRLSCNVQNQAIVVKSSYDYPCALELEVGRQSETEFGHLVWASRGREFKRGTNSKRGHH
jgi:hypothetical protein